MIAARLKGGCDVAEKRKRKPDTRKGDRHTPEHEAAKRERTVVILCRTLADKERWERHVAQSELTKGELFCRVLDAAGVK